MDTKIVDKRNMSEASEHAVSFASRKTNGIGDLGHAFMVWYALEDDGKKYIKRAVGFYPLGEKYKLIAAADGSIADDSETDIEKQLIVQLSSPTFENVTGVESQYTDSTWVLGANDCVSFVARVAEQIPDLIIPSRFDNPTTSTFINAMLYNNN